MPNPTVILGAGPCGLAAGWELSRLGAIPLTLVERADEPGGLARTVVYGDYRIDLSIHRFQVETESLRARLDELFGDQLRRVDCKQIHIHLAGRRIPYPLKPISILRLPPHRALQASTQYLWRQLTGLARRTEPASYGEWFEGTFGPLLYDWIGKPLMEKQWGVPAEQLSITFARHRRLSASPLDLLASFPGLSHLFSRSIPPTMLYGEVGAGELMKTMARTITTRGGRMLTGCRPVRLEHEDGHIHTVVLEGGARLTPGRVLSTIPLPRLLELFDPPMPAALQPRAGRLGFRDMMVVALALNRDRVSHDHVTYFPEERFPFARIYEQKNASSAMVPRGRTIVGFELPCFEGDGLWSRDDRELVRWMASFAGDVGFDPGEVEGGLVFRVPEAYPLYRRGFRSDVEPLLRWVHHTLDNCYLVGRNSLFRMDNMHHAFAMGFDLARHVVEDQDPGSWHAALARYEDFSYID